MSTLFKRASVYAKKHKIPHKKAIKIVAAADKKAKKTVKKKPVKKIGSTPARQTEKIKKTTTIKKTNTIGAIALDEVQREMRNVANYLLKQAGFKDQSKDRSKTPAERKKALSESQKMAGVIKSAKQKIRDLKKYI